MLNSKVLFGVLIIVITASLIAVLISLPQKSAGCTSGDGQCPTGCNYDKDTDCIRSTTTTGGEIRGCLSDENCVIAKPICGNELCNFNDMECQSGCSCGVAINSDYKTVFEAASTRCIPSGKACIKCPANQKAICMSGSCGIII